MNFVALDVETANADLSSICQIGIAHFSDGKFIEKWESLIDPEDDFDSVNISIHGIDETMVSEAPKFSDLRSEIERRVADTVVVCHTHFDRAAIRSVFSKYGFPIPAIVWLDTAKVVRRTWLDLSERGYGLANVANRLAIEFQHHNAAEDARAAGEILLHAIRHTGLSVADWVTRVKQPITASGGGSSSEPLKREGNQDGPLYGEVAVITGTLSMKQSDAADIAAFAGCKVMDTVTKSTTLLIVGDQDIRKLAGHTKSSKHRKAEHLIEKGHPIRILREADFRTMTSSDK